MSTTRWTKRSKSECSVVCATRKLCRFLRSTHGICSQKKNMGRARRTIKKVKEFVFKNVKNSSDLATRQHKRKLSHFGQIANMKMDSVLWTAARVRMNSLLVKRHHQKIESPPSSRPPKEKQTRRKKRQCTSQTFCRNDAVGRFTNSPIFGVVMRRNGLLFRTEKGRVSIID